MDGEEFLTKCRESGIVLEYLGEDSHNITRLRNKIQTHIKTYLVEALVEEFEFYQVALSDEAYYRLQLEFSKSEASFDKLLKESMISSRASLVRFSRQLTQVERTGQTVQDLGGHHGIYLDDTLYSGVNGVIIYEALKLSTPSTRKTDAEKEWRINSKLREEVNNSSNVIKYHDHVVASSGGHYLVMANYGKWSLKDVQASKFKDNFYKDPNNPNFPEPLLSRICCGVLAGLKCLLLIGYSHLDIKLQNIMLASDGTPTIIDLGSCQKSEDKTSGIDGLTLSYAKSFLNFAKTNSHYDLQCLSLVLYCLHTGRAEPSINLEDQNQTLELQDRSLCAHYRTKLQSSSSLDDVYESLKEANIWDAGVAWPSLK